MRHTRAPDHGSSRSRDPSVWSQKGGTTGGRPDTQDGTCLLDPENRYRGGVAECETLRHLTMTSLVGTESVTVTGTSGWVLRSSGLRRTGVAPRTSSVTGRVLRGSFSPNRHTEGGGSHNTWFFPLYVHTRVFAAQGVPTGACRLTLKREDGSSCSTVPTPRPRKTPVGTYGSRLSSTATGTGSTSKVPSPTRPERSSRLRRYGRVRVTRRWLTPVDTTCLAV